MSKIDISEIGLIGLAVMGQNFAMNIAEHGFRISVFNRSPQRVDDTVKIANNLNLGNNLTGFKDLKEFVLSIKAPRKIIMLIQAGSGVDETIEKLGPMLNKGDLLIDGGNEYFQNTEKRSKLVKDKWGLNYIGMGISGGEEGKKKNYKKKNYFKKKLLKKIRCKIWTILNARWK
jgi:6-phosphogluconate dehydrogenase